MANTLFYNVTETNAGNFKNDSISTAKNSLGLINPTTGFGYFIANGKQYGASQATIDGMITSKGYQTASQVESAISEKGYQTASQVESAISEKGYQTASQVESAVNKAKTTVDSTHATFLDKNGSTITLSVNASGQLQLTKYTAASWSSLSINGARTNTNKEITYEYGASYTVTAAVLAPVLSIAYAIDGGTETITNREISVKVGDDLVAYSNLTANNGTFIIKNNYMTGYTVTAFKFGSESRSGRCTADNSDVISYYNNEVAITAKFTGSTVGTLTKTAKIEKVTATAGVKMQRRWVESSSDITVTTPGTSVTANGVTFLADTVTSGTPNFVTSRPTSFTCVKDNKKYIALCKAWGTPTFKDPARFANTAWKVQHTISVYGTDDYDVYAFTKDGAVAPLNAAGNGTWTIEWTGGSSL